MQAMTWKTTYKGLSYILRVLYALKLEDTKSPGLPFVSPTGRFKAATPQSRSFYFHLKEGICILGRRTPSGLGLRV